MTLEHHQKETSQIVQHIESEIHQAEEDLYQGNYKEGEALLWKALTEASGQQRTDLARKILERISSLKEH